MIDAVLDGLLLVFQWPAIGFLVLGVLLGIWLGAVPGLGGIIGLVILLPFTYGMDPVSAFALLLGMFAVTSTSDTIASVMLGIPGTAASQATILDGYPMAQQGKAARAFGAAFTVSAFGGVFGALILAVSIPLVLPIILAFGSPELLMLGVLGLAMVGSLSGGSILKGLIVALLGLMISMIGYAEMAAIPALLDGNHLPARRAAADPGGARPVRHPRADGARDPRFLDRPGPQGADPGRRHAGRNQGRLPALVADAPLRRARHLCGHAAGAGRGGGRLVRLRARRPVGQGRIDVRAWRRARRDRARGGEQRHPGRRPPAHGGVRHSRQPRHRHPDGGAADPGSQAGPGNADRQARPHLQHDLDHRHRQHPGRRAADGLEQPGRQGRVHPGSPDRPRRDPVRVHGGVAGRGVDGRLDRLPDARGRRLRHEARRLAEAAAGSRPDPRAHPRKRFPHQHAGPCGRGLARPADRPRDRGSGGPDAGVVRLSIRDIEAPAGRAGHRRGDGTQSHRFGSARGGDDGAVRLGRGRGPWPGPPWYANSR